MALDIASVNLSCSGDIGASSVIAGGGILLPRVELTESSVFSGIVTSRRRVLLAHGLPGGNPSSAVWNSAADSPKVAFAVWKVLVTSVSSFVRVGSRRPVIPMLEVSIVITSHVGSFL